MKRQNERADNPSVQLVQQQKPPKLDLQKVEHRKEALQLPQEKTDAAIAMALNDSATKLITPNRTPTALGMPTTQGKDTR